MSENKEKLLEELDGQLSTWPDTTKFTGELIPALDSTSTEQVKMVGESKEHVEKANIDGVFIDPAETARLQQERNTVVVEPVEMEEYTEIMPTNDGTIVRKAWRKKEC